MEFMYDIDMLEIIRWPFTEGFAWTSEAFLQFMNYYQGLGHYRGPGPPNVRGLFHNFLSDLAANSRGSRSDCDESDEVLMVTSNDALRFEEDCLFESLTPVSRNAPASAADVGDVASNRFLCQKTSMADMTLAELNDTNAHHDVRFKVGLAVDRNSNSPGEIRPAAAGSQQAKSVSDKEPTCAGQPVSSKINNSGGSKAEKLLFACKTEPDQDKVAQGGFESKVKVEPSFDYECSSQTSKDSKRRRASSNTLSRFGIKGDHIESTESRFSKTSALPTDLFPLKKKLKLEIAEDDSDLEHAGSHSKASYLSRAAFCRSDDTNSCDDQSDSESLASKDGSVQELLRSSGTEKRYFWQYNIQAKGPKEKRLCRKVGCSDPHVLKDFEDPVFDSTQRDVHFIHGGKARKGDGTDITPNPRKLLSIGNELKSLNQTITKMIQSADAATRVNTMKEKNKYASRVCRLKKKAQHEANKIKLQGLNDEHNQLMLVLNSIKSKLKENKKSFVNPRKKINFTNELETLVKSNLKMNVAGHADDYVSSILLSSRSSSTDDPNDAWLYSE